MLNFIILGFLIYGEKSGYDLKQTMVKSTSNFFDASFGSIYPALNRLEASGQICSREVVDGGKFKKLYTISESGRAELIRWLEEPLKLNRTRPDHLVQVFFYRLLPPEKRVAQLEHLIGETEAVLEEMKAQDRLLAGKLDLYFYSTLKFGLAYYPMVISWCRSLLEETAAEQERQSD